MQGSNATNDGGDFMPNIMDYMFYGADDEEFQSQVTQNA